MAPTTGTLAIQAVTTGESQDTDGYSVKIAGRDPVSVPSNGTVYVAGLAPGAVNVVLDGKLPSCSTTDGSDKVATVVAGDTVTVRFDVRCLAAGAIRVRIATVGDDLDDGYSLILDGAAAGTVAPNGDVFLTGVTPGSRVVEISGIAANCILWDEGDRRPGVVADDTTTVVFDFSCVRTSVPGNRIFHRIRTIGDAVDPDGYLSIIDGFSSKVVGMNDTTTHTGLAAGEYSVRVGGVASRCFTGTISNGNVTDQRGSAAETRLVCYAVRPGCEPNVLGLTISSGLTPVFQFSERCHFSALRFTDRSTMTRVWFLSGSDFRPSTFTYERPPSDATVAWSPVPLVAGREYAIDGEVWTQAGLKSFVRVFTAR